MKIQLNLFVFIRQSFKRTLRPKENSLVGFNFEVSDELKLILVNFRKISMIRMKKTMMKMGLTAFEWGPVPLNFELYAINKEENELLSSYKKLQWYPADIEGLAVFWLICIYHQ